MGSILRAVAYNSGLSRDRLRRSPRGVGPYIKGRREFQRQAQVSGQEFRIGDSFPCLFDRFEEGGIAQGAYFHQDLYVAQGIHRRRPVRHIDVGSRVDGFVAHVASYRPIEIMDVRQVRTSATNITTIQRDVMVPDPEFDACTDSLSCLHALEHFGLGRYGEPIDYYGYLKGWKSISRMVAPGGMLYLSLPISWDQRVEFDGHRVFTIPYLRASVIDDRFDIEEFAFVDDDGELHREVDVWSDSATSTFELSYGCGIFELRRRPAR